MASRIRVLLVCVVCAWTACAVAGEPRATRNATTPASVRTAINKWYGIGEPRDPQTAAKLFRRLSRTGDPVATSYLALMTKFGENGGASDLTAARGIARRAEPMLRRRAEAGDAEAASVLATLILEDLTREYDTTTSLRLRQAAAERGVPEAQAALGRLYWRGGLVRKDLVRAEMCLTSAAEAGSLGARVSLGYMLFAEKDYINHHTTRGLDMMASAYAAGEIEGLHWLGHAMEMLPEDQQTSRPLDIFRECAEKGSLGAMCDVGWAFLNGKGYERDEERAVSWFRKAAARGHEPAMIALARYYETTTGPQKSTSEALWWLRRAADYGSEDAYYRLAYAHYAGRLGLKADAKRELSLIRKAAERGSFEARSWLAGLYLSGEGVEKNPARGVDLLLSLAEDTDGETQMLAMEWLAHHYDRGARGVPANGTEAVRWLRRAAGKKSGWALARLGDKYLAGEDVEQNTAKAFDMFRRSAETGHANGMAGLGFAYQHGYGTPPDLAEARKWYRRAAEKGSKWATQALRALDGASKPGLFERMGQALRASTTTTTATRD